MEQSLADLVKLSRACLVTPIAPHNDNIVIDDNSVTSSRSRDSPDMSIPILKGENKNPSQKKPGKPTPNKQRASISHQLRLVANSTYQVWYTTSAKCH